MSKITDLKLARRFERDKETHSIERREEPMKAIPRGSAGNCYICHDPVYAHNGQMLQFVVDKQGKHHYSHKACRKQR